MEMGHVTIDLQIISINVHQIIHWGVEQHICVDLHNGLVNKQETTGQFQNDLKIIPVLYVCNRRASLTVLSRTAPAVVGMTTSYATNGENLTSQQLWNISVYIYTSFSVR